MSEQTAILNRHARSFSIASRFLPADVREDVAKLYAWCRICDDAVDNTTDMDSARDELARLRSDIVDRSTNRERSHDASKWILELIDRRGVSPQHALDLLEGMRMDLDGDRIASESDLLCYAYHVAGVVGLMMSRVMGVHAAEAARPAKDLGIAMQLTNIARDVREDAARGRSYLPGIDDPVAVGAEATGREVRRILKMAEKYYASGRSGIHHLPRRCRPAIAIAADLYREIGREIVRRDYRVLDGRVVTPRWRMMTVVIRSALKLNDLSHPTHRSLDMNLNQNDARYVAFLGLSLTAFTATALFVLVYLNPKESTYQWLPLVYAGVSFAIGVICNRMAARLCLKTGPSEDISV